TVDTGEVKPHGEASPRLVAGPTGRLAVVWPRDIAVAGRQWPASAIRVARSLDGGRTWLPPHTVNDDTLAAPVGHNFQGAAWAGDSGLVAAWLDERTGAAPAAHHHDRAATAGDPTTEPDATVYLARSPDFGRTWERNQATWGGACPCCRITLARHADGRVAAAWRHHFPGNVRDVVVADVEPEPGPPERVHPDGWVYPGCPHNGPGFAVGPDGKRHVVWYTGAGGKVGLYYATVPSTSPGAAPVALVSGSGLPAVHGSVLGLAGGGAVAAYDAAADGSRAIGVAVMRPGERVRSAVVPGGAGGLYPQLAAASAEAVVMAYTGHDGDRPALRLARVALPEADH
ncbi:MAG TPA: sialidase family protein, partial [Gemmatimonadales bacterium]|nr:sialidase family protein [Gemmatimonadales bacterium]